MDDSAKLNGLPAIERSEEPEQISVSRDEARKQAKESMDFLGVLALPTVVTICFCALFKLIWSMLTTALTQPVGSARFAIGLPRGHGKTMVIKLLCLWTILFTRRKFILIVGSTDTLAKNILSDVWDLLNEGNIVNLFGSAIAMVEKDTEDLKKFSFNGRSVILASIGFNGSVRGLNLKFVRPDVMIFDDAQTRECAMSPTESKKFQEKFYGTYLKLKAPTGCIFIYIGNMYKDVIHPRSTTDRPLYCCLLRNFRDDKFWTSFITGALLANGTALWEELIPKAQLLEELQIDKAAGQEEEWFAEVQNDPECGTRNRVDFGEIPTVDYNPEDTEIEGAFIMIDPATDKPNADEQIRTHIDIVDGVPVVYDIKVDNSSPKTFIQNTIAYCLQHQIPLICIEDVAYQYTLLFWFEETCRTLGITGIVVQPIAANKAKNAKILDSFKAAYKGEHRYHQRCFSLVVNQAAKFDQLVKNNVDDILDTIANIPQALQKYKHLMYKPLSLEEASDAPLGIPDYSETSCI